MTLSRKRKAQKGSHLVEKLDRSSYWTHFSEVVKPFKRQLSIPCRQEPGEAPKALIYIRHQERTMFSKVETQNVNNRLTRHVNNEREIHTFWYYCFIFGRTVFSFIICDHATLSSVLLSYLVLFYTTEQQNRRYMFRIDKNTINTCPINATGDITIILSLRCEVI